MASPKVIILSDGTGNAASSVWRTNVWRIFQALDLQGNAQAAKYDDGVGTSSFVPLAILGGAFGYGLKRNILDAYKFICRNYDHVNGSKIYLFGFSRGAFTARVLAALILEQGLIIADTESELHDGAVKAYRAYRAAGYHSVWRIEVIFRAIRDYILVPVWDRFRGNKPYSEIRCATPLSIEFVGLWDTVAAYGLPIDEMTRGISNWVWPLELPNRVLNPRIKCARHALALDDERTTFHPVLWTEQTEGQPAPTVPVTIDGERLVQVWFVGMHANVGGGYPDDAVAFVPLAWLVDESVKRGLVFKNAPDADPDALKSIKSSEDKDGRLYDSRSGLGAYYRYGPRKVAELCNDPYVGVSVPMPKIHESVFERIDSGCNSYAPIGLPPSYVVVSRTGQVAPLSAGTFETPVRAPVRYAAQEKLWNYVWLRRIAYFATLAASLHLAAFWLFHGQNKEHEFDSYFRMVSESVRLIESFLPTSLHWWTDWYAGNPEWFAGGIIAVAILMGIGGSLSGTISDRMRIIWRDRANPAPLSGIVQNAIYCFRTSWLYQWVLNTGRRYVVPFFLAAAMVWFGATVLSHFLFNVADSTGAFCKGTPANQLVAADKGIPQNAIDFDTSLICAPTGLAVRPGFSYEISITMTEPWEDDGRPVTPGGYRTSTMQGLKELNSYATIFLRRILFRPWYRLIARVGATGVDEYFLDPKPISNTSPQGYKARFTAERSGEIFLYVNQAVIGLPWVYDWFYGDHKGRAKVTVKLL
ncbi:hypothetical protein UP10_28450 [Bradyrhizobium sp. LTSPM299]|uniref:DUF2235 domain-containing protein n=1 Tax=Bradyrhizobium sp. LTSPM299 TaxID=1619233 RepID=UPI0005C90B76|nr:DUF2235 domain-containing protein [Bradyrhizobium sp. LTSPM299]KJC57515.1 hypothetical protein UP10_28450 [Bradyrhizobium sp. LTSPM299]